MMLNLPLFRIIHELQAVAEGVYMEGGVKKKTDMTSLYFDNRIFIQLQVYCKFFQQNSSSLFTLNTKIQIQQLEYKHKFHIFINSERGLAKSAVELEN